MKRSYYKKKDALIVGGSEGIGLAIAEDLLELGANVTICSRSEAKLRHAREILEKKCTDPDQKITAFALDVTDAAATQAAIDSYVQTQGVPQFLFNCAGYSHPGYIDELDVDVFRKMIDLNYLGTVHATKAMVPYFRKASGGCIVNVSSMAGFIGLFGYTGYCASKYAVIGFSQALAQELRPFGIQVSVLCPPNTRTPGLDKENEVKPAEVLKVEEKVKVVEASDVSRTLLKQLPKKRSVIVPTLDGTLAYYLSRYAPAILARLVRRPALSTT